MASVEIRGLRELTERFDRLPNVLKRARRDALDQAGQKSLSAVRGRIGGRGKVQGWQENHLGSGWGYAAARPDVIKGIMAVQSQTTSATSATSSRNPSKEGSAAVAS